jgi:hypothetical protein
MEKDWKEIKEKRNKAAAEGKLLHPFELFGIECEEGWKDLYQPIIDWIGKYNEEHPEDIINITQIKEKFGGLRFYVDKYPKELEDMIINAESMSYYVCERCGTRENVGLTVGGWYRTICLDCLQKMLADENYYKTSDKWKKQKDGKFYKVTKDTIEIWKPEKKN